MPREMSLYLTIVLMFTVVMLVTSLPDRHDAAKPPRTTQEQEQDTLRWAALSKQILAVSVPVMVVILTTIGFMGIHGFLGIHYHGSLAQTMIPIAVGVCLFAAAVWLDHGLQTKAQAIQQRHSSQEQYDNYDH